MKKFPRVLVCQHGARHRYAIPRMLEEAGMLAALYTDSCVLSPLGKIATSIKRFGVRHKLVSALAARRSCGIPEQKVFSSDRLFWSSFTKGAISPDLAVDFKKWGLQGVDIVYSMYGENPDFLEWAKEKGAKIVVDVFIHPGTNRIIEQEQKKWPAAGNPRPCEVIEREDLHSKRVFALADVLLAPSCWVAEGIWDITPEFSPKIRILPYGSSVEPIQTVVEPAEHYFLFAGREPLRKGLPYLAEAAALVHQQYPEWKFKVAGVGEEHISWIPNSGHLTCLGSVPMSEMQNLYVKAWAFVLPSLSEGQAGVLLEAMACGCPVIATKESGIDFASGCGITVPSSNATALAEAIIEVIDNRQRRNELANGALRQAHTFSMVKWKDRLVSIVNEVSI
ncbi:MAG: glycosyltransferase family 4 protein [Desulfobulbus sp.]|nr:glycosyltransferase family 4 protein [Desulfobulbus sp.]